MERCSDETLQLKTRLLSRRLSTEFAFSCRDYPAGTDPDEIVRQAYAKAVTLFDPHSDDSILYETLRFYIENVDKILDEYLKDLSGMDAVAKILPFFLKALRFSSEGTDMLQKKFCAELDDHRDYYTLFRIGYFIELSHTDGIDAALEELEADVNIRANTYYKAAYREYLELLPHFDFFCMSE
ncbi:MAG: hypothetical protein J6O73_05520 [Lachnospiraceae bacterium]|nr:hypothetical protein [Lachnospiraceae bacterium]